MRALPTWLAFLPRFPLGVCTCARSVGTTWYARSNCDRCNGAGVVHLDLDGFPVDRVPADALSTRFATPPSVDPAARAVAGERARCLDAVDAAWNALVARARDEGRREVQGSDLLNLAEDIKLRIIAGEGR